MTDLDYDAYSTPEPPDGLTDSIMNAVGDSRPLSPSVAKSNPQLRIVLIAGAIVAAAAIALLVWTVRSDKDDVQADTGKRIDRPAAPDRSRPNFEPRVTKTMDQRSEPISPLLRRFKSSEARDTLLGDIGRAAARRQKAAGGSNPASPATGGGTGQDFVLTKDDIKASMQEIRPLIVECYEMALETTPDFEGKLLVDFTIIGEPDIGTIVSEAALESEDGMTDDADFSECVEQTILSLELPAPEAGGGEIRVRYPFIFRNSDDDEPTHTVPANDGSSASDKVKASQEAAKQGQFGKALRLCQEALDEEPDNQQALMVCAIAACNLKNGSKAQTYIEQLSSPDRAQMARQICLRNGVELDE
jgi:hypothetical protein